MLKDANWSQQALDSLEMCAGVLLTTSGEMLCQGTLEEAGLKVADLSREGTGGVVLGELRFADFEAC